MNIGTQLGTYKLSLQNKGILTPSYHLLTTLLIVGWTNLHTLGNKTAIINLADYEKVRIISKTKDIDSPNNEKRRYKHLYLKSQLSRKEQERRCSLSKYPMDSSYKLIQTMLETNTCLII